MTDLLVITLQFRLNYFVKVTNYSMYGQCNNVQSGFPLPFTFKALNLEEQNSSTFKDAWEP